MKSPLRRASVFVALSCLTLPASVAQDVTLAPLQWTDLSDPPDELPAPRGGFGMRFPADLRSTTDIHYICYDAVLDAKGKVLMLNPHSTVNLLESSDTMAGHRWRFSAAQRDGKAVNSAITFAVLFNPASAGSSKPDATPRLLDVTAVRLPLKKGSKPSEKIPSQIVAVELSIDANGGIAAIEGAPAELDDEIAIAAKNWRFAPARQAGQNVAAKLRMPVILTTENNFAHDKAIPPRATFQAAPVYPLAMRMSGMRGEVVVDFIVDIEGRVRNPYAIRSLNPSFDEPAIDAVRKWRFEPARVGDRPVKTHMQVPIFFQLNGGGRDLIELTRKPDLSKLPEELRYDTPPRVIGAVRPIFPYVALKEKRSGRSAVSLLIDERGRVINTRVLEASSPEFGHALIAAVEHFVYEPALKGGRPCKALLAFSQEFSLNDVSDLEHGLLRREQKRAETIVALNDLDRRLKPLSQRPPRFPLAQQDRTESGNALIEFLVDDEGRARLPRIVSATDETFGYAAMQGLAEWRFEPPRRGGRPVIARVRVPVGFTSVEDKN